MIQKHAPLDQFSISSPVQPFAFDHVNDRWPTRSAFPIFQLPIELYHFFTRHLSLQDLLSFALVDQDCCTLARSVLFSTLRIDQTKLDLLWFLEEEANGSICSARGLRIGPCIRRLEVARHPPSFGQGIPDYEEKQQYTAGREYEGIFVKRILSLLRSVTLRNLDIVLWRDGIPLTSDIMSTFTTIPIRALELSTGITDLVSISNVVEPSLCQLEALSINIYWDIDDYTTRGYFDEERREATYPGTSQTINHILSQAAPTVRTLVWNGHMDTFQWNYQSFGEDRPVFPKLEYLYVWALFRDTTAVSHLLAPHEKTSLYHLAMDIGDRQVAPFLSKRGSIPSLREIRWLTYHGEEPHTGAINFLQSNPQITSFVVATTLPALYLSETLLPALSKFRNLVSLRIGSDCAQITTSDLSYISRISTLRQLWLTAGFQPGWRHTWRADHATMLSHLCHLENLERLALTRDAYEVPGGVEQEEYYDIRMLPVGVNWQEHDLFPAEAEVGTRLLLRMTAAWEKWHMSKMLEYASCYANVLPKLRWCFLGQIPIGVKESEAVQGLERIVFAESEVRLGGDISMLDAMWGISTS